MRSPLVAKETNHNQGYYIHLGHTFTAVLYWSESAICQDIQVVSALTGPSISYEAPWKPASVFRPEELQHAPSILNSSLLLHFSTVFSPPPPDSLAPTLQNSLYILLQSSFSLQASSSLLFFLIQQKSLQSQGHSLRCIPKQRQLFS